ncbi:MAG: division/cell wall cluster transcriptional repressor MraZ [Pseudomonadota bacterium]
MFRGATKVTIDDKGRVVIPTRHRALVAEHGEGRLVVTVDRDQCLLIYPAPEWEQVEKRLMNLPSMHPQSRRLQRLMVGHATDVELDSHGRLALSTELREFAALKRAGMLIGQGNRLELWDEARWNEQRNTWLASERAATDLATELDSLSL